MSLRRNAANRLKRRGANRIASAGGALVDVAGTGITITDTVYQRVYQRVGTAKTITVSGTYSGTPTRILARHCPVGTPTNALTTTYPWRTLVNNPTGGVFSAGLSVPQGDRWVVQVRDGVNASLAASGTHTFGVGIFVVLAGQSNMENMFTAYQGAYCGDKSAFIHHGSFDRVGNVNDDFPYNTLLDMNNGHGSDYVASGYTPAIWLGTHLTLLANTLVAELGVPVVILPYAASGTSIEQWQPGQAYLNALFNNVDLIGGDFEYALWLQGENNAASGTSAATYQSMLQTLFNTCKAHTGRTTDFNFGVVAVGPITSYPGVVAESVGPIRKAQLDFVAANAANGAYLAGTDVDGDLAGGGVHIDTPSLLRQAKRYAESIKRRFFGAAYNIEGPKIASATRSGSTITVSITQQGGTTLLDGAGGLGTALQGFRVFDNGTPATISNTAISGNTITLTLASTPGGTVTMDYAMANAPFGGTVSPASVCYDNQTVPGDTVGLPLQPRALMAVA